MRTLFSRFRVWRLQWILVVSFVLATAITVAVGFWLNLGLINNYLQKAEQERVSRDMDLARAFYDLKRNDISSMAARLASRASVRAALPAASVSTPVQKVGRAIASKLPTREVGRPTGA